MIIPHKINLVKQNPPHVTESLAIKKAPVRGNNRKPLLGSNIIQYIRKPVQMEHLIGKGGGEDFNKTNSLSKTGNEFSFRGGRG